MAEALVPQQNGAGGDLGGEGTTSLIGLLIVLLVGQQLMALQLAFPHLEDVGHHAGVA